MFNAEQVQQQGLALTCLHRDSEWEEIRWMSCHEGSVEKKHYRLLSNVELRYRGEYLWHSDFMCWREKAHWSIEETVNLLEVNIEAKNSL